MTCGASRALAAASPKPRPGFNPGVSLGLRTEIVVNGAAMDGDFNRFEVMVAIVIATLMAAWIIVFAGFWIWAAMT